MHKQMCKYRHPYTCTRKQREASNLVFYAQSTSTVILGQETKEKENINSDQHSMQSDEVNS